MDENTIWNRFLRFEKENNLFELQTKERLFYWDIVRFEVYSRILWKDLETKIRQNKKHPKGIKRLIIRDFLRLFFTARKKKNLFYLSSRNKQKELFFDQNAQNVYDIIDFDDSVCLESYYIHGRCRSIIKKRYVLPQHIFRKLFFYKEQNFNYIIGLLKQNFPDIEFDNNIFNRLLKSYYADLFFYRWLFKRNHFKRVFITQNGLQKALIAVAKERNVMVYEFQHGVVNQGHLAYNYPKIDYKESQVHLPNKILSLSSFWFKDVFMPNVEICPAGNDYFYESTKAFQKKENKGSITIISSITCGQELSNFILSPKVSEIIKQKKVYFKLHPNQFTEELHYKEKLKNFANIEIITNTQSVGDLLQISDTVLAIQSTVIYEALQAMKRVIILKRELYALQKGIFNHPNLHIVDTAQEFYEALDKEINTDCQVEYFSPFDKEIFSASL